MWWGVTASRPGRRPSRPEVAQPSPPPRSQRCATAMPVGAMAAGAVVAGRMLRGAARAPSSLRVSRSPATDGESQDEQPRPGCLYFRAVCRERAPPADMSGDEPNVKAAGSTASPELRARNLDGCRWRAAGVRGERGGEARAWRRSPCARQGPKARAAGTAMAASARPMPAGAKRGRADRRWRRRRSQANAPVRPIERCLALWSANLRAVRERDQGEWKPVRITVSGGQPGCEAGARLRRSRGRP
jgi:hypothetical protein